MTHSTHSVNTMLQKHSIVMLGVFRTILDENRIYFPETMDMLCAFSCSNCRGKYEESVESDELLDYVGYLKKQYSKPAKYFKTMTFQRLDDETWNIYADLIDDFEADREWFDVMLYQHEHIVDYVCSVINEVSEDMQLWRQRIEQDVRVDFTEFWDAMLEITKELDKTKEYFEKKKKYVDMVVAVIENRYELCKDLLKQRQKKALDETTNQFFPTDILNKIFKFI